MPTLHPTAVAQNLRLPVMTDNPWPSGNQNKKMVALLKFGLGPNQLQASSHDAQLM